MTRHDTLCLVLQFSLLVFIGIAASATADAQEQIPWSVIATGGVVGASDGTEFLSATLGQAITGPGSNGTNTAFQGFWVPLIQISSVEGPIAGDLADGAFRLHNFPNPFSTATTISYTLEARSRVRMEIFDLLGKSVATLVDDEMESGDHNTEWNGLTENGSKADGGIYICTLSVDSPGSHSNAARIARRKLVLVR